MCPVCLATITTQLIAGATSTGSVAVLIARTVRRRSGAPATERIINVPGGDHDEPENRVQR